MLSTRRRFLRSALVLPSALAASAYAQETKNTPPVSFADFENGWDDWTVEGLAFDTRPATNALFPGKISGFGGRGFVCTLHPRRGNAATGKAVSRPFTIDKPFITFKIGGGNFPGQACLNLVVDGKIERTATGDGTANLSEKSWDVSALVGKKARLEIIDDTVSDQRGYVLVDDIAFVTGNQFTTVAEQKTISLRLQIISVTDDDGSNGVEFTRQETLRAIAELNKAYAPAGVQFLWDAEADFSIVKDSYLNRDFDITTDAALLSRADQPPAPINVSQHYEAYWKASQSYHSKVPIFMARGIDWKWDNSVNQWRTVPSNTSHGMPPFIFCRNLSVIKHELGHLFGLVHTADFNKPFNTMEEVVRFVQDNVSRGMSPEDALGDLDLDKKFGVLDTLPSPSNAFYNKYRPRTDRVFALRVPLPDTTEKEYQMDCRNPMGSTAGSFSPDQCRVIRANAEMWQREGGTYPTNAKPANATIFKFETLRLSGNGSIRSQTAQFHRWHGSQRYTEIKGELEQTFMVDLVVPKSGIYDVRLYAACAVGYGQLKVTMDGTEFSPIDLWGPHWFPDNAVKPRPSGGFALGSAKLAQGKVQCTFKIVGKNRQSTGYDIGLEAIAILPT